tara:strand:+ start:9003 stop:10178 length:1176 start_codon:yes stop_codon:yes gene_type:complete
MNVKKGFDLPNKEWQLSSPVKVFFGTGSISNLNKIPDDFGKKCLIITGPNIEKSPAIKTCKEILDLKGHEYEIFSKVDSEPTSSHVNDIVNLFSKTNSEFLIAVGGGSALDAAKAASVIIKQGGDIHEYFQGKLIDKSSIPLIVIPTTSGTGAELSKGAIISWPEKGIKTGLRGEAVYAHIAIVDPNLTISCPSSVTKISGFDVFTHALETYLSRASNKMTSAYSLLAIENVTESLPKLLNNPGDLKSRNSMSFYSMLMGFNLANSSTCLPHRLQYPLGELTKTPHALGLAAIYPSWVEITMTSSKEKLEAVADRMYKGLSNAGIECNDNKNILKLLKTFMTAIDLQPRLSDFNLNKKDCFDLSNKVSGNLANDPWWSDGCDLTQFYLKSL